MSVFFSLLSLLSLLSPSRIDINCVLWWSCGEQVYLAQDQANGHLFALKKIRCPLGSESVKEALREVEGAFFSGRVSSQSCTHPLLPHSSLHNNSHSFPSQSVNENLPRPTLNLNLELEAYKRFRHPNIIRCLDSCVVQDVDDSEAKIVYVFLPYYEKSVQDLINQHSVRLRLSLLGTAIRFYFLIDWLLSDGQ